jgi:hypothetical protein
VALSYSVLDRSANGDLFFQVIDITLDNSYPSGGWPVTAQSLGFGVGGDIYGVIILNQNATGRHLDWDQVNKKIMCRDASGAANAATPEITTATQMNTVVLRVLALGRRG